MLGFIIFCGIVIILAVAVDYGCTIYGAKTYDEYRKTLGDNDDF